MKFLLALLTTISIALPASAEWSLDSKNSSLSFVSVKNGILAEIHEFKELEGAIDGTGTAVLTIDLDSVDTLIPIRDERMRKMLFDTSSFPEATVEVQLDNEILADLAASSGTEIEVFGTVTIKGKSQRMSAKVQVSALQDGGVMVSTVKPVLVGANQFNLISGLEALRAIAGLTSITPVSPVTFNLAFQPAKKSPEVTRPTSLNLGDTPL